MELSAEQLGQLDLSNKALANPACPICLGAGSVERRNDYSMLVFYRCDCAAAGQAKIAEQVALDRLFPGIWRSMTLDSYDPGDFLENEKALKAARKYVAGFEEYGAKGRNLGFQGTNRSGKTHLAVGIAQACLIEYGIKPYVISLPALLRAEKKSFSNDDTTEKTPVDLAAEADLLILDDIGAEYLKQNTGRAGTSWIVEQLFLIIDARTTQQLPTIYTTNLEPSVLGDTLDHRVWSRLSGNQLSMIKVKPVPGRFGPSRAEREEFNRD